MPDCFIAQLTEDGGPDPRIEIDRIVRQAEPTDTVVQQDFAWFPTRLGTKWEFSEHAQCLVFFREEADGPVDAIRARVLEMSDTCPNDPVISDFYEEHEFSVWWKVTDVTRELYASIDDIPGKSRTDLPASQTFAGSTTFAYWTFENEERDGAGLAGENA